MMEIHIIKFKTPNIRIINFYFFLHVYYKIIKSVQFLTDFNFFFLRLAQSVRVVMALAIFLSYGLQFYVPIGIVWPALKGYFHSQSSQRNAELSIRVFLVTLTCKFTEMTKILILYYLSHSKFDI